MNARRLVEVSTDDPRARALLAAYFDELRARFDVDIDLEAALAARDMDPPKGAFVLLLEGDTAVACGGVRMLAHDTGETKRMFVAPEARRRGHARALLAALEDLARARGATRMVLDTDANDAEAIALYTSAGYAAVPRYNDNPDASAWFAKPLA